MPVQHMETPCLLFLKITVIKYVLFIFVISATSFGDSIIPQNNKNVLINHKECVLDLGIIYLQFF